MKKKILTLLGLIFIPLIVYGASTVVIQNWAGDVVTVTGGRLDVNTRGMAGSVVTLLNAVTTTGASASQDVSAYSKKTFHIVATSVSSGATIEIETSNDDSNWVSINSETIAASGTTEVAVNGYKHVYIRANATARTDGTYTVTMVPGD